MKRVMVLFSVSIIFIVYMLFTALPLGIRDYYIEEVGITLTVPRLSTLEGTCCMFVSSFRSIRKAYALEQEMRRILQRYEEISCNGQTYHYNSAKSYTIVNYSVRRGLLFNELNITFTTGNYCEEYV